eukprot:m.52236 g.52236  ORF g.52236 m.52236 type:complete len:747 (+) comp7360_c0_seq2:234-2474(+)
MAAVQRCEFFLSVKGCSRGKRCRFAHDKDAPLAPVPRSQVKKTLPTTTTPSSTPSTPATLASPARSEATRPATSTSPATPAGKVCHYFLQGTCARGNKCRFSHGDGKAAGASGGSGGGASNGGSANGSSANHIPRSDSAQTANKRKRPAAEESRSKVSTPAPKVTLPEPESSSDSSDSDSDSDSSADETPAPPPPKAAKAKKSKDTKVKKTKVVAPPVEESDSESDSDDEEDAPPMDVDAAPSVPSVPKPAVTTVTPRTAAAPTTPAVLTPRTQASAKPTPTTQTTATRVPATPPMLGTPAAASPSKRARTETHTTPLGGAASSAAATSATVSSRGVVLDTLVRATRNARTYKEAYAGCTWNPLPPGWVSTSASVHRSFGGSAGFPVVGLDCEFVECAPPFGKNLARVTLVALGTSTPGSTPAERIVLLDSLVRPTSGVVDYKTTITGLTAEHFGPDTACLSSVEAAQAAVLQHVEADTILVGHALHNDLESLRIAHNRVIDTGLMFVSPLQHLRIGLKDTVLELLGQECQPEGQPHDSAEDAAWSLELVRHVVDRTDAALGTQARTPSAVGRVAQSLCTIPIPQHFGRRFQIHMLPESATIDAIRAAMNIPSNVSVTARPISFRKSKHNDAMLGSTVFTFDTEEDASRVFTTMSTSGMKNDKDGLPQKKVTLNQQQFPGTRFFWVKAFCTHPSITSRRVPGTAVGGGPAPAPAVAAAQCVCPKCFVQVPLTAFCCQCGSALPPAV